MDREGWWAIVHEVAESKMTEQPNTAQHICIYIYIYIYIHTHIYVFSVNILFSYKYFYQKETLTKTEIHFPMTRRPQNIG